MSLAHLEKFREEWVEELLLKDNMKSVKEKNKKNTTEMTGYQLFVRNMANEGCVPPGENLFKIAAECWKNMSEEEKKAWKNEGKIYDLQVFAEAVSKTLREIKLNVDDKVKFSDCKYGENKKKLIILQLEQAEQKLRSDD